VPKPMQLGEPLTDEQADRLHAFVAAYDGQPVLRLLPKAFPALFNACVMSGLPTDDIH